jgi:hypothetical protein
MALHLVELDKNTHTWFPNTHSSCRFYDNSRLKNFIFVFFSSYKQTHERSCFAKTIDPREWDPRLISTLQHSLYNQPWLRIRKKDFVYSNSTDPKSIVDSALIVLFYVVILKRSQNKHAWSNQASNKNENMRGGTCITHRSGAP